jgi:hypothetical protein
MLCCVVDLCLDCDELVFNKQAYNMHVISAGVSDVAAIRSSAVSASAHLAVSLSGR